MSRRERFGNLAVLAVALLICFIVAEILFSFFGVSALQQAASYRKADDVFHHGFVPDSSGTFKSNEWNVGYSINSLGFRDKEYNITKPAGVFRILVLGDSYAEGHGVRSEDTFSKQLEVMLNANKKSAVRYEVIDAGVSSYSPILEYLVLKYGGLALQPDMVMLNYDWSDPYDDYLYSRLATFNGSDVVAVKPLLEKPKSFSGKVRDFLSRHSYVYQFFAVRLASATSEIVPGAVGSDRLIFMRENLTDSDYTSLFNNSVPYLLKIRQLSQQNNASFVIHIYPYALQISTEAWRGGRGKFFFLDDRLYPTKPFEIMEDFGMENNITVVSSYSYFRNAPDPAKLYFDYDGHFTPEGHKVAATALYTLLENSTILPRD